MFWNVSTITVMDIIYIFYVYMWMFKIFIHIMVYSVKIWRHWSRFDSLEVKGKDMSFYFFQKTWKECSCPYLHLFLSLTRAGLCHSIIESYCQVSHFSVLDRNFYLNRRFNFVGKLSLLCDNLCLYIKVTFS